MGVVLHDDPIRLWVQNGPANVALIRQAALNIFKRIKDKAGMKIRRKAAAWEGGHLFSAIRRNA